MLVIGNEVVMEILYLSVLSSERIVDEIHKISKEDPGFAVQKFSRLLVSGIRNCGENIIAFSSPPISPSHKMYVRLPSENEKGVAYRYVPFINIPIIKHIIVFVYTFIYVLFWGGARRNNKVIICDTLAVSLSWGALLATKINRIKSVAVVTDVYSLMIGQKSLRDIIASKIYSLYVSSFDGYVLLTEQMNDIINLKSKPYLVMEALCDAELIKSNNKPLQKVLPRIIMYAGGIYEEYGLKTLAEAFIKSNIEDAVLVYYGSGPYVQDYMKLCETHPNLRYAGVLSTSQIVEAEKKSSLLVNPRFSTEEYTKYSFPSKNIEYMVSGTPLLTTRLPGMPEEYYPYVFLFEEESVDGFASKLRQILSYPTIELQSFGARAQNFVLQHKNNKIQGSRIAEFIRTL